MEVSHRRKNADREHYEYYFSSGYYDRRYPRANPNVLRILRTVLPKSGAHVIDYGCGSGRYLLALEGLAERRAGFDICESALGRFREACERAGSPPNVHVLGPEAASLERHVAEHGRADVVICLFGVISHIEGVARRRDILRRLAGLLKPDTGKLVISVPNRARRFRKEQRSAGYPPSGEVRYARSFEGRRIEFSYKLYDSDSLRSELEGAGFAVDCIEAESLAPESMVANWGLLRALDSTAAPWIPPRWGYGLVSVARPLAEPARAEPAPRLDVSHAQ